jgi:hypothetical protein
MAVARLLGDTEWEHHFSVIAQEHPWQHPTSGKEGYIDIIAERPMVEWHRLLQETRLVMECKRGAGQDWLFLCQRRKLPSQLNELPGPLPGQAARIRVMLRSQVRMSTIEGVPTSEYRVFTQWQDLSFAPAGEEASYCIQRTWKDEKPGERDSRNLFIENIARELLPSVEALAVDEQLTAERLGTYHNILFIPVIVTNARLWTYVVDPGAVDLDSGQLLDIEAEAAKGTVKQVDMIRFRKGLRTSLDAPASGASLSEINQARERTVLVVNSARLGETLKSLVLSPVGADQIRRLVGTVSSHPGYNEARWLGQ